MDNFQSEVFELYHSTDSVYTHIAGAVTKVLHYLNKVEKWLTNLEYLSKEGVWQVRLDNAEDTSCIHGVQEFLCRGIKSFLVQLVEALRKNLSHCKSHIFLRVYMKYWQQYSAILSHLNTLLVRFFNPLSVQRFQCHLHPNSDEDLAGYMKEEALNTWGKLMIKPLVSKFQKQLKNGVRATGQIGNEPDLVHNVFESISQVSEQMCLNILEEVVYLKKRRAVYSDHAKEVLREFGNSKYIEELTNELYDSEVQLRKIIGEASFKRMAQHYHVEMLSDHLPFLRESCFEAVANEQWQHLLCLYYLLRPFKEEIEFLLRNFENYIKDIIFFQLNDGCLSQVQVIGDFHSECSKIVHQIFKGDIQFIKAVDQVCSQAEEVGFALEERRAFYRDHATEIHEFGNSKYIEELVNKLDDDKVQLCKIIGEASFKRMDQQYHVKVLSDHLPFLQESCFEAVTQEQWKDLYDLLSPFLQEIEFLQNFEKYIKDKIFSQLNDECLSPAQVILDFHSECLKISHHIFKDDIQFIEAIYRVCSQALNSIQNPIQVMAFNWNLQMMKGIEEKDVAEKAKQYVDLLKHIKDWESFCNFSNLLLSRRLLRGTTCSINAERTMVEMLTEILGISHTYKLSTMLTDMSISDNITADFKTDLNHNSYASCEKLSFQVLNSFAWPHVKTNISFNIPKELGVPLDMFQSFYKQKFPHKKLTWHHKRSSCEVQLLYLRKPYLVLLKSSYIASLLLLFDNQDSFSIQELADKTYLPLDEVIKNLQALVDVKLLVGESSATLHHKSIVSLNMSFTNKRRKILVQYKS